MRANVVRISDFVGSLTKPQQLYANQMHSKMYFQCVYLRLLAHY